MGADAVSKVLVNGTEMSFQGSFGFKINNQEYTTKNGRVYNSQGQAMKELNMPDYIAEQFFAMSNMSLNDKQDNIFTQNDIEYAKALQEDNGNVNGSDVLLTDMRLKTLTGSKGKVINGETKVESDEKLSSQYRSNATGRISTISVWLNQ